MRTKSAKGTHTMTTLNDTSSYSPGIQRGIFAGGLLADTALSGVQGHSLAQQLAAVINTPNVTVYDKAIDSVYLSTRVGGSQLHHLLDGQHDIFGAFKAAANALPDDSLWQEVMGTAQHLGKDLFSVSGLPVVSVEPSTYAKVSTWLHDNLHISKRWLGDLLQINGMELFAGMLSVAAVMVGYHQADIHQLAELCSASGLAGVLTANPIGLCSAALALVLAWKCSREDKAQLGRGLLVGLGTAGAVSLAGTGLAALGLGAGLVPAVAGICLNVVIGLYVRRLLSKHLYAAPSASDGTPLESTTLQWVVPELDEFDILVRRMFFKTPYPVPPEVSSLISSRLNESTCM